ncbi:LPXTG cell wall anchor domain-containing protein [Clostridium sp. UBA4395]|uniref:LPXTG cell wall anchor domain-containing protein n=1 Tax=Clostridium sp. UBA4395 TaxID=1946360 RepID=UPI003216FE88
MKKLLKSKLVMSIMMMVLSVSTSSVVFAAEAIANGKYGVSVTSSSAMFKVIDAKLSVLDEKMSAVITLSGTGYSKLYMGTKEDAALASENDAINYVVDDKGMYTYSIPVSALDTGINVAAFSTKNQTWYDRTLTFNSSTLVLIEKEEVEQPKEDPKSEQPKEEPVKEETNSEQPKEEPNSEETKQQQVEDQKVNDEAVKPNTEEVTIPKTGDNNIVSISAIVLLASIGILIRDKKINKEA